jgi:excinuclease UvrABC ATPase subunit
LSVVTGVAGSGKSTLISKVLPLQFPEVKIIDQSPIIGHSRATLLTYLGFSDKIRKIFADTNKVSNQFFSSNSQGACPNCKGLGIEKIDLAFMDDIEQPCEVCHGSGFAPEVLKYKFRNKSIADVMNLTVEEAVDFFGSYDFVKYFNLLSELGLDYLKLGQRLSTFSGGERQRLKLSGELKGEGNVLVMDEPSTGLHPSDTEKLMLILNKLVGQGDTLIVIEHNLDIISQADWIIDIGPGAGKYGGELVFEGTVGQLLNDEKSETAKYLRKHLNI